jgi:predicted alpha-1,6-mannanase (GH76 family)
MITTLANFANLNIESYLSFANYYFETTLVAAPASNGGSFLNDYYDDEGWWAMAWVRIYDLTQNSTYLDAASTIFDDMRNGEGATCGGHWWSKDNDANTAIGNELYLAVAASLANRIPDQKSTYQDIATREYNWFIGSGMLNSNNTFNDGLDLSTCEPEGTVYTYNQGVILGALIEMNRLTNNQTYLDTASLVAHGAIAHLTDSNGILTEPGYPNPTDTTGAMFKGVFARNLGYLQSMAPDDAYVTFLKQNADAIWSEDRQGDGQIGPAWQGPYQEASAASQDSALDCLVAAASVTE